MPGQWAPVINWRFRLSFLRVDPRFHYPSHHPNAAHLRPPPSSAPTKTSWVLPTFSRRAASAFPSSQRRRPSPPHLGTYTRLRVPQALLPQRSLPSQVQDSVDSMSTPQGSKMQPSFSAPAPAFQICPITNQRELCNAGVPRGAVGVVVYPLCGPVTWCWGRGRAAWALRPLGGGGFPTFSGQARDLTYPSLSSYREGQPCTFLRLFFIFSAQKV